MHPYSNTTPNAKVCPFCRQTKPVDQFARDRRSDDGLHWRCKECERPVKDRYAAKKALERRPENRRQTAPPFVLCACGCGQPTLIATYTNGKSGSVAGQPAQYLPHHNKRGVEQKHHDRLSRSTQGYLVRHLPGGKKKLDHRAVWEETYGPIPKGFVIHHRSGDKTDNRLENLQLMSLSEHARLHKRGPEWTGWSRKYAACVRCAMTDRPHHANGLCERCRKIVARANRC